MTTAVRSVAAGATGTGAGTGVGFGGGATGAGAGTGGAIGAGVGAAMEGFPSQAAVTFHASPCTPPCRFSSPLTYATSLLSRIRSTTSSVSASFRDHARNFCPSIRSPTTGHFRTRERAICEPNPAAKRSPYLMSG